jgi:hypothetical protein
MRRESQQFQELPSTLGRACRDWRGDVPRDRFQVPDVSLLPRSTHPPEVLQVREPAALPRQPSHPRHSPSVRRRACRRSSKSAVRQSRCPRSPETTPAWKFNGLKSLQGRACVDRRDAVLHERFQQDLANSVEIRVQPSSFLTIEQVFHSHHVADFLPDWQLLESAVIRSMGGTNSASLCPA